jgi:hypothetical protein
MTQYRELNEGEQFALMVLREVDGQCAQAAAMVAQSENHNPEALAYARQLLQLGHMALVRALTNPKSEW